MGMVWYGADVVWCGRAWFDGKWPTLSTAHGLLCLFPVSCSYSCCCSCLLVLREALKPAPVLYIVPDFNRIPSPARSLPVARRPPTAFKDQTPLTKPAHSSFFPASVWSGVFNKGPDLPPSLSSVICHLRHPNSSAAHAACSKLSEVHTLHYISTGLHAGTHHLSGVSLPPPVTVTVFS